MINKSKGLELTGEWWDSPVNYADVSCVFCYHFCSYAEEYEDNYEPADCGRCSNSNGTHVSGDNTCQYFVLSDYYSEQH